MPTSLTRHAPQEDLLWMPALGDRLQLPRISWTAARVARNLGLDDRSAQLHVRAATLARASGDASLTVAYHQEAAEALGRQGRHAEAASLLEDALRPTNSPRPQATSSEIPDLQEVYRALVRSYCHIQLSAAGFSRAEGILQEMVTRYPTNYKLLQNFGIFYLVVGKWHLARPLLGESDTAGVVNPN